MILFQFLDEESESVAESSFSTQRIPPKSLGELLPLNEVLFFPDIENKNLQRIFTVLNAAQNRYAKMSLFYIN